MPRVTRQSSTAAQSVIAFPVQKRRSRTKHLGTPDDVPHSHKRKSCRSENVTPHSKQMTGLKDLSVVIEDIISPVKKTGSGGVTRKVLSPMKEFNNVASPTKVMTNLFGSPSSGNSKNQEKDLVDQQLAAIAVRYSPHKETRKGVVSAPARSCNNSTKYQESCSSPVHTPMKSPFSPLGNIKFYTPDKAARALDFSCDKSVLSSIRVGVISSARSPSPHKRALFLGDGNVSPKKIAKTLKSVNSLNDQSKPSPGKHVSDKDLASPARQSPRKHCLLTELATPVRNTPSKQSRIIELASPLMQSPRRHAVVKELASPLRQSPSKHALVKELASPLRQSPRKHALVKELASPLRQSPRKHALIKELASPLRQSPRKHALVKELASPLRQSPRKHALIKELASPLRQSPRKHALLKVLASPVRQSPRKHALSWPEYMSPLCLAKQEGLCYLKAKQALHTAHPERIVCREAQLQQVECFLQRHLFASSPGSMYISGAPGTGKTAVLSYILKQLQGEKSNKLVYINCMSFKNSQAIFNKILLELTNQESSRSTKEAARKLEKLICSAKRAMLFILDEIDQLDSKNQEVLYTMFEWPTLHNSKLVLIGIANALDLTDRILPRLQARPNCKPQLLHFPPYTKDQIMKVLQDRLHKVEVEGTAILEPSAIRFCAMKVATVAGDMRKALDICRRAVESVEMEVRKQRLLQHGKVMMSPSKSRPVLPKKIGVVHIMKIINEVDGCHVSSSGSQTVPLQQKLAICTLLLMVKQVANGKEVTLGKLHDKYIKVCKRQQVEPSCQSEFLSICTLIEAKGIISLKKARDARNIKLTLKLDEGELEQALQDRVLVSTILAQGLP